ncbi:hypothetical protein BJV82DRAFT_590049 [Fennellomyces sp. T-0311]|nr:hypothetical protein BJV82DRAFT_590049 [Fennellomyces sp. T-0311]
MKERWKKLGMAFFFTRSCCSCHNSAKNDTPLLVFCSCHIMGDFAVCCTSCLFF